MNRKYTKTLIEWGLMLTIGAVMYFNGWHTEVIGKVQQGVLLAGLIKPEIEDPITITNPKADFSLSLRNQEGELVEMQDLKGKVIFLNLWATWCPPCVAEMPGINALAEKVKDDEDIVFLMLSLDKDFQKAKNFKERKGFMFDVHQLEGRMPQMYYSRSIPTTFVISAKGELVLTQTGMAEYNTDEFRKFLLSQKK